MKVLFPELAERYLQGFFDRGSSQKRVASAIGKYIFIQLFLLMTES